MTGTQTEVGAVPVPRHAFDLTEVVVASEVQAAAAWAARHGWTFSYQPDTKVGAAITSHPVTGSAVEFRFDTAEYPDRQPPAWWCGEDPKDPRNYPAGPTEQKVGYPTGSIFHPHPVICAPWNRMAYAQVIPGAPHAEWDLAAWKTMAPEYTRAHTIADMLAALELHLSVSCGMQAT